ncbi:CaiF/GrlA family transcriptional regulator, partial [Salmonella enterica]|nr:CaiF/GrlA family transcriptional regulator [Salmonella enterica]
MAGKLHHSDKPSISSDSAFTGKKKVKQSNHETYTLPVCMAQWADEPLYL